MFYPSILHHYAQIIFLQLLRDVLDDNECMERLCDQKDVSKVSVEGVSVSVSVSDEGVSEKEVSGEGIYRAHNGSAALWDILHAIGDHLRSTPTY